MFELHTLPGSEAISATFILNSHLTTFEESADSFRPILFNDLQANNSVRIMSKWKVTLSWGNGPKVQVFARLSKHYCLDEATCSYGYVDEAIRHILLLWPAGQTSVESYSRPNATGQETYLYLPVNSLIESIKLSQIKSMAGSFPCNPRPKDA